MADTDQQNSSAVADRPQETTKEIFPEKKSKTNRVRIIAIIVVILLAVAAYPIYSYYSVRESTDDAEVDGHLYPISARISGTVIAVNVDDNQEVPLGKELVKLDPADYQVQVEQAQAELEDARAATNEAQTNVPITSINTSSLIRTSGASVLEGQAGVHSAEQQVSAAKARLETAKSRLAESDANYTKAQQDLRRFKELVDKDEISKQQYDAAVASADSAKADVDTQKSNINEAQHNVDVALASLEQAKARLNSALVTEQQSQQSAPKQIAAIEARYKSNEAKVLERQAAVDQAKLNIQYTIITAPVAGLVTKKSVEVGQRVQPGEQLMTLVPLDDVWVTANYKETQLKRIRIGQKVEIEVDAFGGRKYQGVVDSIAALSGARSSLLPPENATGNYVKVVQRVPVKIVLDKGQNQDHLLRPGMSVVPVVLLNSGPDSK
ncbi:MAG: HlyD family secretion protein [Bryobacteraceae bacterium]